MKTHKIIFLFFSCLILFSIDSCQQENLCTNVVCQNGGTCNNGVCSCVNPYFGTHCDSLLCNLGYEGNLCQTECRNKYSGLFSGSETDSTGTLSYNIRFDSVMNDVTKIKVLNTYNASITINGTFRQNCSINIDTQAIGVGQIYGSVTIIGGKISYQYFLSTGGAYEPHTWVQN